MGFFDRAIKKGISEAIEKAVESKVVEKIAPKYKEVMDEQTKNLSEATRNLANAQNDYNAVNETAQSSEEASQLKNTLGGLFSGYADTLTGIAEGAAKNVKLCPNCGEGNSAEKKFCASCGTKLPEETMAEQMYITCPNCGNKNRAETRFCGECGGELPFVPMPGETVLDPQENWSADFAPFPVWTYGKLTDISQYENQMEVRADCVIKREYEEYKANLLNLGFKVSPKDGSIWKVEGNCKYSLNTQRLWEGGGNTIYLIYEIVS
ncbi:MAG: hypothetical protein GX061_06970 [Eubacteriaceae bacterium]|nr:hypothetical protein [Eubacteriaceae bacterium]